MGAMSSSSQDRSREYHHIAAFAPDPMDRTQNGREAREGTRSVATAVRRLPPASAAIKTAVPDGPVSSNARLDDVAGPAARRQCGRRASQVVRRLPARASRADDESIHAR
jgi:hypothetical protein